MKKYILLLVTAFSFAQASNQMVTFTQAQSLGFTLNSGQSHITSTQCMTKNDALVKYNLSASAMSSYASNQLVPKSDWVNGVAYFTHNISSSGTEGVNNATCSSYSLPYALYSNSSAVQPAINLYTNTALTIPYMGRNQTYYHAGTNQLISINDSGVVTNAVSCQQTSYPQGFSLYTNQASLSCDLEITYTYYSSHSLLGVGSVLYNEANLATTLAGSNRWILSGSGPSFKVDNSGVIIEQYNCN